MLCLDVPDLPDGWTPLRSVSVIEALQDDGTIGLVLRLTPEAPGWVLLGMLAAASDTIAADLVADFVDEGEEDGETSPG